MSVEFHYGAKHIYEAVPHIIFEEFATSQSPGNFFHTYIKNKLKMAKVQKNANASPAPAAGEQKQRPKSVNRASLSKRFIKISLDADKINKAWIRSNNGKRYIDITLSLLPDGTLDKFGNLGMVTQDVPKEVYAADKTIQGEILGNGFEFAPRDYDSPADKSGELLGDKSVDDLPF